MECIASSLVKDLEIIELLISLTKREDLRHALSSSITSEVELLKVRLPSNNLGAGKGEKAPPQIGTRLRSLETFDFLLA